MDRVKLLKTTQIVLVVESVLILGTGTILLTQSMARDSARPPDPGLGQTNAAPRVPGQVLFADDMESYVPGTAMAGSRPNDGNPNAWTASLSKFKDGADPNAHNIKIAAAETVGNKVMRFKGRNGGKPDIFLYRAQRQFKPAEPATGKPVLELSFYIRFNKPTGHGHVNVSLPQTSGLGTHPVRVTIDPALIGIQATSRTEPGGAGKRIDTSLIAKGYMKPFHWYRITVTAYLADVAGHRAKTFDVSAVDLANPLVRGSARGLHFNNVYDSLNGLFIHGSGALPTDMDFDIDDIRIETRAEP